MNISPFFKRSANNPPDMKDPIPQDRKRNTFYLLLRVTVPPLHFYCNPPHPIISTGDWIYPVWLYVWILWIYLCVTDQLIVLKDSDGIYP
ncbi:MAG: hypothetical protein METHAR1v1_280002 [Methanothrix sp.]|nr:MAG: hypothetical protein METHAR1v1_280002 [Methanothrix sp.]